MSGALSLEVPLQTPTRACRSQKSEGPARGKQGLLGESEGGRPALYRSKTPKGCCRFNLLCVKNGGCVTASSTMRVSISTAGPAGGLAGLSEQVALPRAYEAD